MSLLFLCTIVQEIIYHKEANMQECPFILNKFQHHHQDNLVTLDKFQKQMPKEFIQIKVVQYTLVELML
jgi:hypothetical protein